MGGGMTNEDILRMAREANLLFPGVDTVDGSVEQLERFFHLAYAAGAAAEREACAKVCEQLGEDSNYSTGLVWGRGCALAIRARGSKP